MISGGGEGGEENSLLTLLVLALKAPQKRADLVALAKAMDADIMGRCLERGGGVEERKKKKTLTIEGVVNKRQTKSENAH